MRVYVNDRPIELLPGMKVRHALIGAGCPADLRGRKQVYDEWGNLLGLDGALFEGMKIFVK
jgi:hypothetical protein